MAFIALCRDYHVEKCFCRRCGTLWSFLTSVMRQMMRCMWKIKKTIWTTKFVFNLKLLITHLWFEPWISAFPWVARHWMDVTCSSFEFSLQRCELNFIVHNALICSIWWGLWSIARSKFQVCWIQLISCQKFELLVLSLTKDVCNTLRQLKWDLMWFCFVEKCAARCVFAVVTLLFLVQMRSQCSLFNPGLNFTHALSWSLMRCMCFRWVTLSTHGLSHRKDFICDSFSKSVAFAGCTHGAVLFSTNSCFGVRLQWIWMSQPS